MRWMTDRDNDDQQTGVYLEPIDRNLELSEVRKMLIDDLTSAQLATVATWLSMESFLTLKNEDVMTLAKQALAYSQLKKLET